MYDGGMRNLRPNTHHVTLPDGSVATRKSDHNYVAVAAIQIDGGQWFAEWRNSRKAAEQRAAYWKTCPAAKAGQITVETQVIDVKP